MRDKEIVAVYSSHLHELAYCKQITTQLNCIRPIHSQGQIAVWDRIEILR